MRDRFYNALKERDSVIKERDYLRNQLGQLEKLQAGIVGQQGGQQGGNHDSLQLPLSHPSQHGSHHHAGQLDLSLNGGNCHDNAYKRSPNAYGSLAALHHQETAKLMSSESFKTKLDLATNFSSTRPSNESCLNSTKHSMKKSYRDLDAQSKL
eukprot:maker-scaffold114_size351134-snap-gene-1.10 protein:Tk09546 transcript:maker-scaffold114_size351134-snap-gene-1.10-mRNA-1 annotation:"sigma-54 modulation protein"